MSLHFPEKQLPQRLEQSRCRPVDSTRIAFPLQGKSLRELRSTSDKRPQS